MTPFVKKVLEAKTIVAHDHCADGTASAVLLKGLVPEAEVVFCQYGTAQHKQLPVTPGMVFVDFSPHPDRVGEFVEAGAVVFDHHGTQKEVVAAFNEYGIYEDGPGICGATLVYKHLWQPLVRTGELQGDIVRMDQFAVKLALLAGIRDTWQNKDSQWEEACIQSGVLEFMPTGVTLGQSLLDLAASWDRYLWVGKILWQKRQKTIMKLASSGYRFTTKKGTRVIVLSLNGNNASDVSDVYGTEADLVVGGFYVFTTGDETPKLVLSCRSKTTYDVATLCKSHGGGGHPKAAGMTLDTKPEDPHLYSYAERLIRSYEGE